MPEINECEMCHCFTKTHDVHGLCPECEIKLDKIIIEYILPSENRIPQLAYA